MKTKHTPGPWHVTMAGHIPLIMSDSEVVGEVRTFGNKSKHNAHLIAAAPELLSALEALVTIITTERDTPGDVCDATVKAAQKAIDKAKGENG